jgi:putative oxidoreductase
MLHVEPSPRLAADATIAARLQPFAGLPLALARAMLAYLFVVEGYGKIVSYNAVADYMRQNGVASTLLPLVIVTELGGGLLVLFGFKTRWAAVALGGFCLLTALLFHMAAEETVQFQKNVAMAGGFLALATAGPGPWSVDAWRARKR